MNVNEEWLAMNNRAMRKSTREATFWFGVSALGAVAMALVFYFGH
jgi:hypothetical protein